MAPALRLNTDNDSVANTEGVAGELDSRRHFSHDTASAEIEQACERPDSKDKCDAVAENGEEEKKNSESQEDDDSVCAELDDQHTVDIEGPEVEKAPDGGWGWLIILGTVLLRCIIGGLVRSRGILFMKFQDRFHGSATSTALLTSLSAFVRLAVGPTVSILTNRFACRNLTMIGVIIVTASYVMSAYTPNQGFLYFSFGVLSGLGRGFILTPIPILLGSYFDKRRSLAFGLASSGFSLGGFALTPVVEILFQTYGFQGAFLILGGFAFQILAFATLFRPIELHRKLTAKTRRRRETPEEVVLKSLENLQAEEDIDSSVISVAKEDPLAAKPKTDREADTDEKTTESEQREKLLKQRRAKRDKANGMNRRRSNTVRTDGKPAKKKKLIDLTILKDVRYMCYVFATMCFALPSPGLFLPSIAKDRGLTEIQAASLLSVSAGFDAVCRVISGFVLDLKMFRTIRPEIFNAVTFCQCITMSLFPSMRTFGHFFALCAIQGSLVGIKNAQGSVIVMDMLGVDKLASSLAVTMTAQGISVFIGPTISGQLTDIYGTYDGTYYFGSCAVFVGASIMAFGQIRKRCVDRAKKNKADGTDSESVH